MIKLQQAVTVGRNKLVSISEDGIKTLAPGRFVNDNIIDFCCVGWHRRNYPRSHLFKFSVLSTQLRSGEYDAVAHWTANRGIDIFDKKMILIPVNIPDHWSLCAVINAGYTDFGVH